MEHWQNLSLEDIEGEVWKPIVGWEGLYEVSNKGRVKSLPKKMPVPDGGTRLTAVKIHKPYIGKRVGKGYCRAKLNLNNASKKISVHRLVATHFIPNPENYPVVNHLDSNILNNEENNLEWTSISGNILHAIKMGRIVNCEKRLGQRIGITHGRAILKENDVYAIRKRWDNGERASKIIKDYPQLAISSIRSVGIRKNWKHLPEKGDTSV